MSLLRKGVVMTDIKVCKKNKLSNVGIRMSVKNVEKFDPEIQKLFYELIDAVEYPKQCTIEEYLNPDKESD